jgi:hypothetical protein
MLSSLMSSWVWLWVPHRMDIFWLKQRISGGEGGIRTRSPQRLGVSERRKRRLLFTSFDAIMTPKRRRRSIHPVSQQFRGVTKLSQTRPREMHKILCLRGSAFWETHGGDGNERIRTSCPRRTDHREHA